MKSIKYYLLSISLLLSPLIVLLSSSNVGAVSVYDGILQATDNVYIQDGTCDQLDLTLDWSESIYSDTAWQGNTINPELKTTVQTAFDTALDNTTGWAVQSNNPQGNTTANFISIFINADENNEVDFATVTSGVEYKFAYLHGSGNSITYVVNIHQNTSTCEPYIMMVNSIADGGSLVSHLSPSIGAYYEGWGDLIFNQLFINSTVNYPEGYEGEVIGTRPAILPSIDYTYTLSGNNLYLSLYSTPFYDEQNIEIFTVFSFDTWPWLFQGEKILKCEVGVSPSLGYPCPVGSINSYRTAFQYSFDQEMLGETVDFAILATTNDGYESNTKGFSLVVGSSSTGGSFPDSPAPPALLPCGDWDFVCIIGRSISNTFTYLFVPTTSDIQALIANFSSSTYGIADIIMAPLRVVNSLNDTSACVGLQLPIPYTGTNLTIPCMADIYEDNILGSTLYTILSTILTGIVAYGVAINSISIIKGLKDPEDDKIEVHTL